MLGYIIKLQNDHTPTGKGWKHAPTPPTLERYLHNRTDGRLVADPYKALRTDPDTAHALATDTATRYPGATVSVEALA